MPLTLQSRPVFNLQTHPICRGDFAALVFSGAALELGELPGEPTSLALFKFALPDPRLHDETDFARTPGMPLPLWPADRVVPTAGVCFVFSDLDHPLLELLIEHGGIEHEHYVVASDFLAHDGSSSLDERLASLLASTPLPQQPAVAVLGYGHQGAAIARRLVEHFEIARSRVLVYDSNEDSLRRAAADGFTVISDREELLQSSTVLVYSPLAHHQQLAAILSEAMARGLPTLHNAKPISGAQQFRRVGDVFLDGAAASALEVNDRNIKPAPHDLPLTCSVIREDVRKISGCEFPHLHGVYRFSLANRDSSISRIGPAPADPLAHQTLVQSRNWFVSLRERADFGYFAARHLCQRLWPAATRKVFPSAHAIDLGATALERLLQGHLCGREIVSTMQTPAQRVTLAVAARHYAAQRDIIEIGSAFGGSALLMAAATESPDSTGPRIHSIDPETSTRDIMRFAFQREGQLHRLNQIVLASQDAIAKLSHLHGRAGVVFIDGLHTQAGVMADVRAYAPLVAEGGALIFHDVVPQIYSVFRVVIDHMLTDERFDARCMVDGLMVFERRD